MIDLMADDVVMKTPLNLADPTSGEMPFEARGTAAVSP